MKTKTIPAMKPITDLRDLMIEQLRSLYVAETQVSDYLKQLQDGASDGDLYAIIADYRKAVEDQVLKIKRAFNHLYELKRGETCPTMEYMIREGTATIQRTAEKHVKDAAIVTVLQHIIHYKIASYGAICTYSNQLNHADVAELIHPGLDVEKRTDRKLAMLAEGVLNKRAAAVAD
jgi:ferritin-like metal-binding protein YciE